MSVTQGQGTPHRIPANVALKAVGPHPDGWQGIQSHCQFPLCVVMDVKQHLGGRDRLAQNYTAPGRLADLDCNPQRASASYLVGIRSGGSRFCDWKPRNTPWLPADCGRTHSESSTTLGRIG
ncbi:hypothetical protein RE428_34440 [Marinobacter nanhaiticus D15-8W]|nr:hypothetical protein RE428_34440 [Marinobacter nanhaiticus D15-8W]